MHESEDNLWNFLFFTGYMKKVSERKEEEDIYLTMKIPNVEIRSIYKNQIRSWFEKQVKDTDRGVLYKAVLEGDTDGIASYVTNLLKKSISTFDSEESFYHGFFLSLLYGVPNYAAHSNREEGVLDDGYIGVKSFGICFCKKACIVGEMETTTTKV